MKMLFKPFALVAAVCALALGLAGLVVNPVAAICHGVMLEKGTDTKCRCECGLVRRLELEDSFLFVDGKYDEDAQEQLAHRRRLSECLCGGERSRFGDCCEDECGKGKGEGEGKGKGDDRRRLQKTQKGTRSPKCSKSSSPFS